MSRLTIYILAACTYVSAAKRAHFQLEGGLGGDRLAATGRGTEFAGPMIQGSLSLRGEEGSDLLIGGPQHSVDRNRDKVLCGPGFDQAYVDQIDDWSRATCEKQHGPDFPRWPA